MEEKLLVLFQDAVKDRPQHICMTSFQFSLPEGIEIVSYDAGAFIFPEFLIEVFCKSALPTAWLAFDEQ